MTSAVREHKAKIEAAREDVRRARVKQEIAELKAARWETQAMQIREVCAEALAKLAFYEKDNR